VFDHIPVPIYCERGASLALLAEPLNVASNIAYLIAAWLAWRRARASAAEISAEPRVLIGLAVTIGLGSAWFHLLGTRTAWFADVIPIGVFMMAYLTVAARRLLGWSVWTTAGTVVAFAGALWMASRIPCGTTLLPMTAAARMPCLNGGLTYVPAVLGLLFMAMIGRTRAPDSARCLVAACGLLAAGLAARTVDLELCPLSTYLGVRLGAHAVWHVLTAFAIYEMLIAVHRFPMPSDITLGS
jgi:hypothetical protein